MQHGSPYMSIKLQCRQAFLIYDLTITFNQVVTWSKHEEKVSNMLYMFGQYVLSEYAKGNILI
jgi:hypothetical protein